MLTTGIVGFANPQSARAALEALRFMLPRELALQEHAATLLVHNIFAYHHHRVPAAVNNAEMLKQEGAVVSPASDGHDRIKDNVEMEEIPTTSSSSSRTPTTSSCFSSSPCSPISSSAEGSGDAKSPAPATPVHHGQCHWLNCSSEPFASKEELFDHVRLEHMVPVHLGQTSYVCQWLNCPRWQRPFAAVYMLQQHMRAHTGEKPYKCDWPQCTKTYSRLENLKTHQRSVHTGERPYSCCSCDAWFSNASDRAKHVNRVHGGQRNYECPTCRKTYTDPSSLRKHMVKSHGNQEFRQYKQSRQVVHHRHRCREKEEVGAMLSN